MFPKPEEFEAVCSKGLSIVRPLDELLARKRDPEGWNFQRASVPSYQAYGRLRALVTLEAARNLSPRRVLEVAAGDAALGACLAMDGAEVVVNDLRADELVASIRTFTNSHQIQALPGNLFDISPEQTGTFDVVIACEVIEHVAHPAELLAHLGSFLSEDSALILTTPNGEYFRNRLPTYEEIDDPWQLETEQFKPDADGHLFLITPRELRSMADLAGLSVDDLRLWGSPFITGHSGARILKHVAPLKLLYALEQRIRKSKAASRFCYSMVALLTRK
jgi:2-polyprenyl-6-hydroxyphenyl methylase/3-demethylubiquinone-9 3-methyltransferase